MDMSGNVAEWCTDFYIPYLKEPVVNPCQNTKIPLPSPLLVNYRAIRGGSWGFYNRSQRVADREFNSQGYPGYYYIGFRIALPAESDVPEN
jgi:formylglycine-generating enzyme required for sulfatase activity